MIYTVQSFPLGVLIINSYQQIFGRIIWKQTFYKCCGSLTRFKIIQVTHRNNFFDAQVHTQVHTSILLIGRTATSAPSFE